MFQHFPLAFQLFYGVFQGINLLCFGVELLLVLFLHLWEESHGVGVFSFLNILTHHFQLILQGCILLFYFLQLPLKSLDIILGRVHSLIMFVFALLELGLHLWYYLLMVLLLLFLLEGHLFKCWWFCFALGLRCWIFLLELCM